MTSTIGVSGDMTSPAYSAKRPPRPTLTEPRRWPAANATSSRASTTTAPSCWCVSTSFEREARHAHVVAEELARLAVAVGGEREVQRRDRLALGDGLDELVLGHRCERVVRASLLADGGHRLGREVLPARRAGAVGREHLGRVGQREQPLVQRVVELAGELVGRDADRGEQVGAADVADEQRVAGEHAVGRAVGPFGYTTMLIDSGVCPGVSRISSSTSPR